MFGSFQFSLSSCVRFAVHATEKLKIFAPLKFLIPEFYYWDWLSRTVFLSKARTLVDLNFRLAPRKSRALAERLLTGLLSFLVNVNTISLSAENLNAVKNNARYSFWDRARSDRIPVNHFSFALKLSNMQLNARICAHFEFGLNWMGYRITLLLFQNCQVCRWK